MVKAARQVGVALRQNYNRVAQRALHHQSGYARTTRMVPTLQPEDLVIMDNLPTHKVVGVREAIEDSGARLLICRPISLTSTSLTTCGARSSNGCDILTSRTGRKLLRATAQAFAAISVAACRGFFLHAKYANNGNSLEAHHGLRD